MRTMETEIKDVLFLFLMWMITQLLLKLVRGGELNYNI